MRPLLWFKIEREERTNSSFAETCPPFFCVSLLCSHTFFQSLSFSVSGIFLGSFFTAGSCWSMYKMSHTAVERPANFHTKSFHFSIKTARTIIRYSSCSLCETKSTKFVYLCVKWMYTTSTRGIFSVCECTR